MSTPAGAAPNRQPLPAKNRVEAIIRFLRENADMVEAANTLRLEINCAGNDMIVKAERGFRVTGEYRVTGG